MESEAKKDSHILERKFNEDFVMPESFEEKLKMAQQIKEEVDRLDPDRDKEYWEILNSKLKKFEEAGIEV